MRKLSIRGDSLGARIKKRRMTLNLTQEELAELMHIPKSTISAYENDKVDIKGSVLVELSDILHTSPNHLLGYEEPTEEDEAVRLLRLIESDEIRESLMVQIRAVSNAYSSN